MVVLLLYRRTSGVTDVIVVEHCEEVMPEWEDGSKLKKTVQASQYVCTDFVVHGWFSIRWCMLSIFWNVTVHRGQLAGTQSLDRIMRESLLR